jgi:hypothetical protein
LSKQFKQPPFWLFSRVYLMRPMKNTHFLIIIIRAARIDGIAAGIALFIIRAARIAGIAAGIAAALVVFVAFVAFVAG